MEHHNGFKFLNPLTSYNKFITLRTYESIGQISELMVQT